MQSATLELQYAYARGLKLKSHYLRDRATPVQMREMPEVIANASEVSGHSGHLRSRLADVSGYIDRTGNQRTAIAKIYPSFTFAPWCHL